FHEAGVQLGVGTSVRIFEDSFVDWAQTPAEDVTRLQNTARDLGARDRVRIGNAFDYSRWIADDGRPISAWLLTFYNRYVFLAITAPQSPAATRGLTGM